MKKTLLLLSSVTLLSFISANTEGKTNNNNNEVRFLTLSNGNYDEFYNNDSIVQVGTALLNTYTNKIVGFVADDTTELVNSSDNSSRWSSVDPLAHKYYQESPYVYVLDNPLKYIDPDGRIVEGFNNGHWKKGADVGAMKIGNAMMATPKGREMFMKMVNASYTNKLVLDPGSNGTRLGQMDPDYKNNTRTITVYEKTVKEDTKRFNDIREIKDNNPNAKISNTTAKGDALIETAPSTVSERIGQVGSHEAEHATNPDAQSKNNPSYDSREGYANKVETEVIKQTPDYSIRYKEPIKAEVTLTK